MALATKAHFMAHKSPFIDYLQLAFNFEKNDLDKLEKIDRETFNRLLKRFTYPYSKEFLNDAPKEILNFSLHKILNPYNHTENCYLIYQNTFAIVIHFKGSFFLKTKKWKDDYEYVNDIIQKIQNKINESLRKYFDIKDIPKYDIKVSRIDLAINHYGKKITNVDKQAFVSRQCKHEVIHRAYGIQTGISLGDKGSGWLQFNAYDKMFDKPKSRENARIRFGTDEFCRNEWQIPSKQLQRWGLKDWWDWQRLFETKSSFIGFILKLRKTRDFTYYQFKHPYNLIHSEKDFRWFKPSNSFKNAKINEWKPKHSIHGILKKHSAQISTLDNIQTLEIINKNEFDLIPFQIMKELRKHWEDKGYLKQKLTWYPGKY